MYASHKLIDQIEQIERLLDPKADQATIFAKMYGKLSAYITEEDAQMMLRFAQERLDKLNETK